MPVLILLGIFGLWAVVDIYNSCTKQRHPHSKRESEQIMSQMIGKSKKECRKILRQHRK